MMKQSITSKNYFLGITKFDSMYVSVFAIIALPFNLELSSFGIKFLMGISKNLFFLIFEKQFLCKVIALFLYLFKISRLLWRPISKKLMDIGI